MSIKPDLVRKFDFMLQVSTLLSTKEMRNLPSCVWSALTFEGMAYSYPICYPASLPTIHPIALTHLKMEGDGVAGASTLPRGDAPTPHRVDDTPVQGETLETSATTRDSGVGSEVSASPPSISPSLPATTTPCSSPGQEEDGRQIDWNSQWGLGLVQPPMMTDTASG